MAEGMPEFTKGEVYGGMMAGFAQAFGGALRLNADVGRSDFRVPSRRGF